MPKQIKVTDELYERLKARANGQPIPKLLRALLNGEGPKSNNADALLEQLDKQAEESVAADYARAAELDDDELPECCQKIYSGRKEDRCQDWVIKNGRYYNNLTHRYIDDPIYVNYFQNA